MHIGSWDRACRGLLPDEYLDAMDVARWTGGWQRILTGERPPGAARLVAVAGDGGVVGFGDVVPSRDDGAGADAGEVTSIYVTSSAWGTGTGRRLMVAAVDRLQAGGCRAAMLWVLRDNQRARRFYERAGWSFDGSTKAEVVAGATVTEIRYRRDL